MKIHVNGVDLFFDVEGLSLRPAGDVMAEAPTLLLLHGGPGADHSGYKPAFSALADVAQVVYLDHRGNGRSDRGPKELWTIDQWADDVKAFCDAIGIVKPVVYGASFGGIVAMAYATRHPGHPARLILVSTTARARSHAEQKVRMFTRLGGEEAGRLARRRFIDGDTSPELLEAWLQIALPLYTRSSPNPAAFRREQSNREATAWFNREGGEGRGFDLLGELRKIQCPTLVLGGALDPMLPIECQRDIAAAIRPELVTFREFEDSGHGVVLDAAGEALPLIRRFMEFAAR